MEAVSDVWGQDRVGVRLSPLGTFNDMGDDDPETTFGHVAEKLNGGALAYLHIVNPAVAAIEKGIEPDPGALRMLELIRERYRGTLIIAGGFDHDTAEGWLQQGKADLIAFGRKFLANPDLPERFRSGASLNADDPTTYYGGGAKGLPTIHPCPGTGRGTAPCVDEGGDNVDVLPETQKSPTGTVSCSEPAPTAEPGWTATPVTSHWRYCCQKGSAPSRSGAPNVAARKGGFETSGRL
jgi:hypothetical protein